MNLVSYEYIACQHGKTVPGVLILSEFAGAAQSLGAGSIRALMMGSEEREALHDYAFKYVSEHTAQKWAETFLQCLQEACSDLMEVTSQVPPLLPYEEFLSDWSESVQRLIIIDLLECLAPARERMNLHSRGRPKFIRLPPGLWQCLKLWHVETGVFRLMPS
eukprot:g17702.t1